MTVLIMVRSVNEEGQGNANDEDVEEVVECDGVFFFWHCALNKDT